MSSSTQSSSVILFAKHYTDVALIHFIQWYLNKLYRPLKLGGAFSSGGNKFGSTNEWIIIKINGPSGSSSQELLLPQSKKERTKIKKSESLNDINNSSSLDININSCSTLSVLKQIKNINDNYILSTTTDILFIFPGYNIIICYELIDSTLYSHTGDSYLEQAKKTLSDILNKLYNELHAQSYVSKLSICIIGHNSYHNASTLGFRGELNRNTKIDAFIESVLVHVNDVSCRLMKAINAHTSHTKACTSPESGYNYDPTSDRPIKRSYPSLYTYLESIYSCLPLLPPHKCTEAILLTTGVLNTDLTRCQEYISQLEAVIPLVIYIQPHIKKVNTTNIHMNLAESYVLHELQCIADCSGGGKLVVRSPKSSDPPHFNSDVDLIICPNFLTASFLFPHADFLSLTLRIRSRLNLPSHTALGM